jgi:hypothetical protein
MGRLRRRGKPRLYGKADDLFRSRFGARVASKNAALCSELPLCWGDSTAGFGEVPTSYRYYLGNLGFFWGIFRDITPIAARQALGWEFRGFLALG